MELNIYQVDTFSSNLFEGNPAAVCPLDSWLPDVLLQKIAEENNLSETAFFVAEGEVYSLRWFTPENEVDLCGHATLASAHVLFHHLEYQGQRVRFQTKSGELAVEKSESGYSMDFPAALPQKIDAPDNLITALGVEPKEVLSAYDYIVVLNTEQELKAVCPDFNMLTNLDLRGVVITAESTSVDFVSRCFYPKLRVNEDPVTGSAYCQLAPYWSQKLSKATLKAKQLSKRTGIVGCEVIKDRVVLTGNAVDYLKGRITVKT